MRREMPASLKSSPPERAGEDGIAITDDGAENPVEANDVVQERHCH